jgi:hypothetical protein
MVAISGAGGPGHLAIQYAKAMGLLVCAIDIDDGKLAHATRLGADFDAVSDFRTFIANLKASVDTSFHADTRIPNEAISKIRRSIRLTPRSPIMSEFPIFLGAGCLTSSISASGFPPHSIAPDWLQIYICQFLVARENAFSRPYKSSLYCRMMGKPEVEVGGR